MNISEHSVLAPSCVAEAAIQPGVYQAWPEPEIRVGLSALNGMMSRAAGLRELQAGLAVVDMLTFKSPMSADLRREVRDACSQARVRVDHLRSYEMRARFQDSGETQMGRPVHLLAPECTEA